MYWVVMFVMISQSTKTTGELDSPHLPWRTTLGRQTDTKEPKLKLCKLPAYPENGNYVVVDAPGAGPGDVFQNVSLVQYASARTDTSFKLKLLRCSSGQWSENIFRYQQEKLYFNASWCSLFCPPPKIDSAGATRPITTTEAYETIEDTSLNMCKLPPYPDRGGYYVNNVPNARPGEVFETVSIQQYILDEVNGVYELMFLTCNAGQWLVKFFQNDSEEMYFNKYVWCPRLCTSSVAKKPSELLKKSYVSDVRVSGENIKKKARCKLPAYPRDGNYTVENTFEAVPNDSLDALHLNYTCYSNRKLIGSKEVYCIEGVWSDDPPKCIQCGSIEYLDEEQIGTEEAEHRKLPWHVAVYDKNNTYEHICSGSIVATNLVLSAAHCFWSDAEGSRPASRFAVAAGKIYSDWNSSLDGDAQKSDVAEIIIHPKFRGKENKYKYDVALVFLDTPLTYSNYVMSLCIDFDVELDEKQLTAGNFGKIGSWSSSFNNDTSKLKVNRTPYVDTNNCIQLQPSNLLQYITDDKICAGGVEGTALCKGDGGAGLSYQVWAVDNSSVNYLRGIASIAPTDEKSCNEHSIGVFSHLLSHEDFLKDYLKKAIW